MEEIDPKKNNEFNGEQKPLNSYAKYTSIAFQMAAIICVFAFIGFKFDEWLKHETQWVTALSCIIGVCLSIYQTVRSLR